MTARPRAERSEAYKVAKRDLDAIRRHLNKILKDSIEGVPFSDAERELLAVSINRTILLLHDAERAVRSRRGVTLDGEVLPDDPLGGEHR